MIAETTSVLSENTARMVEDAVLPDAGRQTTAQLRVRVRGAVIAADPQAAERRREEAERQAKVSLYPVTTGPRRWPVPGYRRGGGGGDGADHGDRPGDEGGRAGRRSGPAPGQGDAGPAAGHPALDPPAAAPPNPTRRPALMTARPAMDPAPAPVVTSPAAAPAATTGGGGPEDSGPGRSSGRAPWDDPPAPRDEDAQTTTLRMRTAAITAATPATAG